MHMGEINPKNLTLRETIEKSKASMLRSQKLPPLGKQRIDGHVVEECQEEIC